LNAPRDTRLKLSAYSSSAINETQWTRNRSAPTRAASRRSFGK